MLVAYFVTDKFDDLVCTISTLLLYNRHIRPCAAVRRAVTSCHTFAALENVPVVGSECVHDGFVLKIRVGYIAVARHL